MKYSEFHRKIVKHGWKFVSATGSHYFYERNGVKSQPVPFHGAQEMGEGLRKKLIRMLEL